MSAGSRRGRARHTKRLDPRHMHHMRPSKTRYTVHLDGGPLDGCAVKVDRVILTSATLNVPGSSGRYVHYDGNDWTWEREHRQEGTTTMTTKGVRLPTQPPAPRPAGTVKAERPELPVSGTGQGLDFTQPGTWLPGDACNACGSTRTVWAADTGAECLDCRRTDADE